METTATAAIAREAARLAFLCGHGAWSDFGPGFGVHSDSALEQEKAELLAGIREEVLFHDRTQQNDLCLDTCRELLAHLAQSRFGANRVTYQ